VGGKAIPAMNNDFRCEVCGKFLSGKNGGEPVCPRENFSTIQEYNAHYKKWADVQDWDNIAFTSTCFYCCPEDDPHLKECNLCHPTVLGHRTIIV
jgi:hypothetical protein